MNKISGDISLMPLPDLLQWAETSRKSGTLSVSFQGTSKAFYLQDGKMIFISSQKEGERLGEFFMRTGRLSPGQIEQGLRESKHLGCPFTGYLIEHGIIDKQALEQVLQGLAETAFSDVLTWEGGSFEFSDTIPPLILDGPIRLNTSFVIFQSVRMFDEALRDKAEQAPKAGDIIKQIARQIGEGKVDIPTVPDIMAKLNSAMTKENISVHDIVKILMADQILTSKILKVVNSAFYSPSGEITSLQQAIIFMGLKSVLSIVTVHTLSSISPGNAEEVKEILRHSLLCAFVAKKIAIALRLDPEEAFVCGLLHDIGKTVMLNMIADPGVTPDMKKELLDEYHPQVGFILGNAWNFSEVIRNTIKYHHAPQEAPANKKLIETVYVANVIANGRDVMETVHNCSNLDFDKINEILVNLDSIKDSVMAII
ncbi:MAG: HDOD domain-containing protein [Nitrospirae bacterium]|nr:HDOD domain-containing protein [Nitrospirota bacterium]